MFDANSEILRDQLKFLQNRLVQRYRPTKFRFLGPLITSAPAWADEISIEHMTEVAKIIPLAADQTQFPMPTGEISESKYRIYRFGAAFGVRDEELVKAQKTGLNIGARRASANQVAAEQLLDQIAATGYAFATGQPLYGLLNQSGVTPASPLIGIWGGATTSLQILADFDDLLLQFESQSKELYNVTHCVLPTSVWGILRRRRMSVDNTASLFDVLRGTYPEITFVRWDKAETAGAAAVSRVCLFSAATEVVNMVIPQELVQGTPIRTHSGFEVAQVMKTAGVISSQKEGLMYVDDLDAAS